MRTRLFSFLGIGLMVAGIGLLAPSFAAGELQGSGQAETQHRHGAAGQVAKESMMDRCEKMMAAHESMRESAAAADARLSGLVSEMNAATGTDKIDAVAAVVSEMVAQRKAMHTTMMAVQPGMMQHMTAHMASGMNAEGKGDMMESCPMMKMMKGAAAETEGKGGTHAH